MLAVVLCAGQGTRLRPLTNDRPKGMVAVGGQSLLEHQVSRFKEANINEVVVVGGYCHETIPDHLIKVLNTEYAETNMVYSLFQAESWFADAEELLISYADIFYSGDVLDALLQAPHSANVVVDLNWFDYFSTRSDNVLDDAESLQIKDGKIVDIGRRVSSLNEIQAQYIGLMKFDRSAIVTLKSIYTKSLDSGEPIGWGRSARDAYMTDLLQEFANQGGNLNPVQIRGEWFEVDTPRDLALAEQLMPRLTG